MSISDPCKHSLRWPRREAEDRGAALGQGELQARAELTDRENLGRGCRLGRMDEDKGNGRLLLGDQCPCCSQGVIPFLGNPWGVQERSGGVLQGFGVERMGSRSRFATWAI